MQSNWPHGKFSMCDVPTLDFPFLPFLLVGRPDESMNSFERQVA